MSLRRECPRSSSRAVITAVASVVIIASAAALTGGCAGLDEAPSEPPPWERVDVVAAIEPVGADPAAHLPADVEYYLRVEGAGALLESERPDPLVVEAWRVVEVTLPAQLGEPTEIRELLGRDLVIAELERGGNSASLVFARAGADRIEAFVLGAELTRRGAMPSLGPWALHDVVGDEGEAGVLAIAGDWLAVAKQDDLDVLLDALTARAADVPLLADDESFRAALEELPAGRYATFFSRSTDGTERHALSLGRHEGALEVSYFATSEEIDANSTPATSVDGVDFGPVPDATVLAGTVNMIPVEFKGEGELDVLLFPGTFRGRVLPRVTPPILFFLGRIEGERVDPDPGFPIPVFGVAIRMTDARVAADLDRLLSRLHFLASLGELAVLKSFFGVDRVKRGGLAYRVADFGPVLRGMARDDWLGRLVRVPGANLVTRIAFGPVGDWYVVASHEEFLHAWRHAAEGRAERLGAAEDVARLGLLEFDGLLVSIVTRGEELAGMIADVEDYLSRHEVVEAPEDVAEDEPARKPRRARELTERPLRWLARGLERETLFSVQLWRPSEGVIRGRLRAPR